MSLAKAKLIFLFISVYNYNALIDSTGFFLAAR